MVHLPVRKCFQVARVSVILVTVVTILVMVERWRGGRRTVGAQETDPLEAEYERQVLEDEARIVPGLGEGGVAAHLTGRDRELGEESEKSLAINVYLSDRIAYNRSLEDHRNPACQRVVYDAELPSASVIIIFHNEPYSVVLRTIWSVVNSARRDRPWFRRANFVDRESGRTMTLGYPGQDPSSQLVYLKEIILVDDNSTLPELKGKLSHYVRTRLPPDLIRILRLPERQGLMLARMRGARSARGEVLVFLDAHCEAGEDWLRPLLQRTRHKRDAVVTPLIDVIDQATFQLEAAQEFQVGGFTFMGHFTWIDVPEREKKRRGSDIAPTWSPTMAGGLFAINREYYWELGAYDEQMAGWGGENLEMSFRIWQCGGTLETIPCSRVGHVFRNFHPYGLPAKSDTHGINTARMAEVWMDDYKELFYLHRPDLRKSPKIGDVTHRKILREKLQCKSFEWYLQHVYKEKFVPVRDAFGYGRFRNVASGLCLDNLQREDDASPLGVYPCHETLHGTQYLSLALDGQLRDEERCVELQYVRQADKVASIATDDEGGEGRKLLMVGCTKRHHNQKWRYTRAKQLVHVGTGLCVDAGWEGGVAVRARRCRERAPEQRWDIDYSEDNGFRLAEDVEPSEAELTLQKLRGQRRISRSLMSYGDDADNVTAANVDSVRRHTHKKRKHKKSRKHSKVKRSRVKTKNKFILKLVRAAGGNASEDHLEVDIHCKHRQLYPNNSFVRDIVTILNDKNIKVINNGRVFERNRVTELVRDPLTMRHKEAKVLEKMAVEQRPPAPPPVEQPAPLANKEVARISVPAPARWPGSGAAAPAKKRKLKPRPPPAAAASQAINAINNALEAEDTMYAAETPVDDTLNDKKIIIEDFVEVKPGLAATGEPYKVQRALGRATVKKRKRKHGRRGDPPAAIEAAAPDQPRPERTERAQRAERPERVAVERPEPPAHPEPRKRARVVPDYEDDSMRLESAPPPPPTFDEVPVVSGEVPPEASKRSAQLERVESTDSAERDDAASDPDADDWFLGDFRSNTSRGGARRANAEADEGQVELGQPSPVFRAGNRSVAHAHAPAGAERPVLRAASAVPLKVIMRSNLTFNLGDEFFKWRTSDDVADILGELAIPLNSSRAPPPLHAWVRPRPAPAPAPAAPAPRALAADDSSSSESADDER